MSKFSQLSNTIRLLASFICSTAAPNIGSRITQLEMPRAVASGAGKFFLLKTVVTHKRYFIAFELRKSACNRLHLGLQQACTQQE